MLAPVRIQDHFPVAPEKQLEEIVLYDGAVVPNGSDVPLTEAITSQFTEIWVKGTDPAAVLTRWGKIDPKDLLNGSAERITIYEYAGSGTATTASGVRIVLASSTSSSLRVDAASTFGSPVGVSKVVGYRKRYVTETKQVTIPVTPDWVSSGSFVNTDEVTVNQRYTIDASKLPSDFRNADGTIKDSVKAVVQLDIDGSDYSGFANVGAIERVFNTSNSTNYNTGAEVDVLPDKLAVRTAGYNVSGAIVNRLADNATSNPWGLSVAITSAPCRVKIWNDEKTAISVPVGDKGYGGITSSAIQDLSGTISATPTVIEFDSSSFGVSLSVTEDPANNQLSVDKVGIWEPDLAVELTTDSSANERIVEVELYNVDLGTVVSSKEVSIVKNQTTHVIDFDRKFKVDTAGHNYQVRIALTTGTAATFIITRAELTITLYTPL